MTPGDAIAMARKIRGLSQLDLAERAGIAVSHLIYLEYGRCSYNLHVVQQIADALDVPLILLVFLAAEPEQVEGLGEQLIHELAIAVIRVFDPS